MTLRTSHREQRFREIYRDHGPAIHAYLARRVPRDRVADLAAETFLVAWRKLPRDVEEPLPWLYAVARRVMLGDRRRSTSGLRLIDRLKVFAPTAVEVPPAEGLSPHLTAALAALPHAEREAILLVAWEGLDHETAGRLVGCSTAAFTVRLSRARTKLRATLGPHHRQQEIQA